MTTTTKLVLSKKDI